jgi:hypothetical protein
LCSKISSTHHPLFVANISLPLPSFSELEAQRRK